MTTNLNKIFPVSLPHNYDNGLGFGQGSTAGVYNQYPRGGFHRPHHPEHSLPEFDTLKRRQFNNYVVGKCDPYKCHYNPTKFFKRCDIPQQLDRYVLQSVGRAAGNRDGIEPFEVAQETIYTEKGTITPLKENAIAETNINNNTTSVPSRDSLKSDSLIHSTIINSQINNLFIIILSIVAFFLLFGNYSF